MVNGKAIDNTVWNGLKIYKYICNPKGIDMKDLSGFKSILAFSPESTRSVRQWG